MAGYVPWQQQSPYSVPAGASATTTRNTTSSDFREFTERMAAMQRNLVMMTLRAQEAEMRLQTYMTSREERERRELEEGVEYVKRSLGIIE